QSQQVDRPPFCRQKRTGRGYIMSVVSSSVDYLNVQQSISGVLYQIRVGAHVRCRDRIQVKFGIHTAAVHDPALPLPRIGISGKTSTPDQVSTAGTFPEQLPSALSENKAKCQLSLRDGPRIIPISTSTDTVDQRY